MSDKPQVQHNSNNSKGLQANRDVNDYSINISYSSTDKEEIKDYGIIEEIFALLFDINDNEIQENIARGESNGKGLKKIPLNFEGKSIQTVNELALKTYKKSFLVRHFIENQQEIDESRVNALVIKLQAEFRRLKELESHYEPIEDIRIIEEMALMCMDDNQKNNPDYYLNALAIVMYFFEMCDFGKSAVTEPVQDSLF